MISLPWGEGQIREALALLTRATETQRDIARWVPVYSVVPELRDEHLRRANRLTSMSLDLIQALAGLEGPAIEEREDDLGAASD